MCGICGFVYKTEDQTVSGALVRAMSETLIHRGPDGDGFHLTPQVALGMRRLSIIDLVGSNQPLYNEDKSIVLIFNGEIFNFRELRENLLVHGHVFQTSGDGETMIHLYEDHAAEMPLNLRGQFAVALWDNRTRRLLLARDHTGEKPLYYYEDEKVIVFASEIKALFKHPAVPRESALSDPSLLACYLGYGYIPAPETAFKKIRMLPPAHTLVYDMDTNTTKIAPYWEMPPLADEDPHTTILDYEDPLRELLAETVRLRLVSDVSLGAFLSGGLDSSLVVAMMQQQNNIVKTFSIGFEDEPSFDETNYAEQVAQHLGTQHTTFKVKADALALLPKLVWHYDQPFADSSAIPTFLVSQLAREHVTVALTGDGGDELFVGYERFYAAALAQRARAMPRPMLKAAANIINRLPEGTSYYSPIKRAGRFVRGAVQPLALAYFDWVRLFSADMSHQLLQQPIDEAGQHFAGLFSADPTLPEIVFANMTTYLPDDLLIKTDRCSMAASLEARAPFMDAPLIEYVASIPFNLKLRGSVLKYILKEAARGLLPAEIIHRKKHGFGVPLGKWLRRDLAPVREVLLSKEARQRGLVDQSAVARLLEEHASGMKDHGQRLWTLLTLEWWHRIFIDSNPTAP